MIYAQILGRWQRTINLVAPSTLGEIWHRHLADSAQLWRFRPESAQTWLDIGSGAGFPGLLLAI
jgi:16S rRNA (guanine527-N7)-methyltransferase